MGQMCSAKFDAMLKLICSKVFMCKMRNRHFKKRFFLGGMTLKIPFRWELNWLREKGRGRGSANPMRRGGQGIVKILYNSYSFVYFYFFGFHEILKNIKNIKTTLNTYFTQQCYIRIILHHTVASAYICNRLLHQHSIAALA